jgi:hypothetical protein
MWKVRAVQMTIEGRRLWTSLWTNECSVFWSSRRFCDKENRVLWIKYRKESFSIKNKVKAKGRSVCLSKHPDVKAYEEVEEYLRAFFTCTRSRWVSASRYIRFTTRERACETSWDLMGSWLGPRAGVDAV